MIQCLVEHGVDKDKAKNDGASPLYIATQNGHLPLVKYLVEQGANLNKADNDGWTPLHIAASKGHFDIISCLVSWGASVTARTLPEFDDDDDDDDDEDNDGREGLLAIDATDDEEIKQLIRNEEIRYRDHGLKRAVLPNPTAAEQESIERAHLEAMGESQYEGQVSAGTSALVAVVETEDEDDDDDSGSDEEHEEAYLRSLKRNRTES